jgi:hypothetical protein
MIVVVKVILFSSLDSRSHNAPISKFSKRCNRSWTKYSEEYFDDSSYDIEEFDYDY